VGAEAQCVARHDGKAARGKASLETDALIFRGDFRLKIGFSDIKKIDADAGTLTIWFAGDKAQFDLGPAAAKWAEKIRHPKSLLDKLGVRAEHRVVALNIHDAEFMDDLRARATGVSTRRRSNADVVIYEAATLNALERLSSLYGDIKPDGMIWTVTPKGKTGIKDTDVMAAGKHAGLVDVKVAAFSSTHTATKFVIPKAQRPLSAKRSGSATRS
jgi:hypothetical protein